MCKYSRSTSRCARPLPSTTVPRWSLRCAITVAGSAPDGLPDAPVLATVNGREYVALATHLSSSHSSPPIIAVLGYSLDDALRPYRSVASAWAILLAMGLLFGLIAAVIIARGVSRP